MELKPIRTQKEYKSALADAERLWDAPAKSPEADRLDVLAMLIEDYERRHFPIPDPDPIEFLSPKWFSKAATSAEVVISSAHNPASACSQRITNRTSASSPPATPPVPPRPCVPAWRRS